MCLYHAKVMRKLHAFRIGGRKTKTLQKTTAPPILKACNCRRPDDCPMAGNCLKSSVVYQATVTTEDNRPAQTYVGLTETSFKARFANHKSSFNDPSKRHSTELARASAYVISEHSNDLRIWLFYLMSAALLVRYETL